MRSSEKEHADKHILTIHEGMELQVDVTSEICSPDSFDYQTFQQAIWAVSGIVQQTDDFYNRYAVDRLTDECLNKALFPFSSNVIAFDGQRGSGKTRMMLSFSQWLDDNFGSNQNYGNGFKKYTLDSQNEKLPPNLKDAKFIVISSILPSIMEGSQNILYSIHTNLSNFIEEIRRNSEGRADREREHNRKELYAAFQACYSGINGIKREKKESYGDMMELNDLGDGLVLRRHFFKLVRKILHYCGCPDGFLVLQLDDADSQMKNGYEVLEDIRKYLQIPNLIILMSADMDMLQEVIFQDNLLDFPDRKQDKSFNQHLFKTCRKYIDKLIPPSYTIHLRSLRHGLLNYSNLRMDYKGKDGKEALSWAVDLDLQDTILMEIYRKTGVLFVRPKGSVHYFIPSTMRGLNQLFHVLSGMEELPIPEENENAFVSAVDLVNAVFKRIITEDKNLHVFSDYFMHHWVEVKVKTEDDRNFLKKLDGESIHVDVQRTVAYLNRRYGDGTKVSGPINEPTQIFLEQLLIDLEKKYGGPEDYYLFCAIRTCFTLNHHKMVLRQKRDAVRNFMECHSENSSMLPQYFAVDYNPEVTFLPKTYLVNSAVQNLKLGESETLRYCVADYHEAWRELIAMQIEVKQNTAQVREIEEKLRVAQLALSEKKNEYESLVLIANEATKNAAEYQKKADAATLEVKLLEAELPQNLMKIIGDNTPVSETDFEFAQKLARAKVLKKEMQKVATAACKQANKAQSEVAGSKTVLDKAQMQLTELKDMLGVAKSRVEQGTAEVRKREEGFEREKRCLWECAEKLDPDFSDFSEDETWFWLVKEYLVQFSSMSVTGSECYEENNADFWIIKKYLEQMQASLLAGGNPFSEHSHDTDAYIEALQETCKKAIYYMQPRDGGDNKTYIKSEDIKSIAALMNDAPFAYRDDISVHPVFHAPNQLQAYWNRKFTSDRRLPYGTEQAKRLLRDCMVCENADGKVTVNFMNFITFLLRLGASGVIGKQGPEVDSQMFQRRLYLIQECALTIASNWEVRDAIYDELEWVRMPTRHSWNEGLRAEKNAQIVRFDQLYKAIDTVLLRNIKGVKNLQYWGNIKKRYSEDDHRWDWSIEQGYRLFEAEGRFKILPLIDRKKLLSKDIFDLIADKETVLPSAPVSTDHYRKPKI